MNLNATRQRRLLYILLLLLGSSVVLGLILFALRQNINLFYTPTQMMLGEAPIQRRIRMGGIVEKNTVRRGSNLEISFFLSDLKEKVKVEYRGILPDLFREGQGIVASGQLNADKVFVADEILAKHDENYMPPEVAGMMKVKKSE